LFSAEGHTSLPAEEGIDWNLAWISPESVNLASIIPEESGFDLWQLQQEIKNNNSNNTNISLQ
jgi:hypothetical protein